jgi:hypothetical protein
MMIHQQVSDASKVFYALPIDAEGITLDIPSGVVICRERPYTLPDYTPLIGEGPFRLWVEPSGVGMDYYLDLTGHGVPVSLGQGIGPLLVAWRDQPEDEIHLLRHYAA